MPPIGVIGVAAAVLPPAVPGVADDSDEELDEPPHPDMVAQESVSANVPSPALINCKRASQTRRIPIVSTLELKEQMDETRYLRAEQPSRRLRTPCIGEQRLSGNVILAKLNVTLHVRRPPVETSRWKSIGNTILPSEPSSRFGAAR
jgi:hypothetical protein